MSGGAKRFHSYFGFCYWSKNMTSVAIEIADRPPETYRGDRLITDDLFPNLAITSEQFFVKAGI